MYICIYIHLTPCALAVTTGKYELEIIYTYIHTYIYMYIHMHIYMHMDMYICLPFAVCVGCHYWEIRTRDCIHIYIDIYM